MRAIIGVVLGLVLIGEARENPFLPASEYTAITTPTNIPDQRGYFEQQATMLPSRARVLSYVVFGFQSLDGSTEEVRMEVDKHIDWQDPLVLTTESLLLKPPSSVPPAEPIASTAPKPTPPVVSAEPVLAKEVAFGGFITFFAHNQKLLIQTKDPLIRHFLMADPYRIVLDFTRNTAFYTKTLPVESGAFKSITMGNHNGHYRAVVLLNGHYVYGVEKTEEGLAIVLR